MFRTSSSRRRPSASRPQLVQEKLVQEKPFQEKPLRKKPTRQTPRQHELTTKRRGELAELAFALKAANLGFGVARPFGDSERYDAIIDARDLSDPKNVERPRVGRTLLSAAFDVPVAADNENANENAKQNAKRHAKKRARRNPKRSSRRESTPDIPNQPDPSPPLWRVQVKCSTQLSTGLYRINAHRRLNGRAVPYRAGEIHFFAAYIIPEDTWYLIPLSATRGATSLLFRRRRDPKPGLYDAYREAWHLLRPQP